MPPGAPEGAGAGACGWNFCSALGADALLLRERLAALAEPAEADAARLRVMLLDWDGRMAAGSEAATAYIALRRALTGLLAERSGLAALLRLENDVTLTRTESPTGPLFVVE